MNDYFINRYRISSARLKDWNYSQSGAYYVTICTQNHKCYFGKIDEDKVELNQMGKTIKKYWLEISKHFSNVSLDEFVIMPNHLHGIIVIDKNNNDYVETSNLGVSTNQNQGGVTHTKNPMGKNNLGEIIRWFKGKTSFEIHQLGFFSSIWQSRFYDHIIRNDEDLNRIREYIRNNPLKWSLDKYYVVN